jgi:predicted PurR-regulated permease PerM
MIGGVIAFGFLGLFLGLTLLATNYEPIRERNAEAPDAQIALDSVTIAVLNSEFGVQT